MLSASIGIAFSKGLPPPEGTSLLGTITRIGEDLSSLTVASAGLAWLISEIWRTIMGLAGWIEKKRDDAERRVEERIETRAREIAEERIRMREALEGPRSQEHDSD